MTAASCFCSRKGYALTGLEVPVSLILIQTGSLSFTFYAFNMYVTAEPEMSMKQTGPYRPLRLPIFPCKGNETMNFKKEDSEIVLVIFILTIENVYPRLTAKLQ